MIIGAFLSFNNKKLIIHKLHEYPDNLEKPKMLATGILYQEKNRIIAIAIFPAFL